MKIINSTVLYILIGIVIFLFSACQMLEPENDNYNTAERLLEDPTFAEGLLLRAYTFVPTNSYSFDDVATDNAVSSDKFNSYLRMATGEWSSQFNPQDQWTNANRAIMNINEFLSIVDRLKWKYTDKELNDLYVMRLEGEAYALRALFKYYILRNHGGISESGELLGGRPINMFPVNNDEFTENRASFHDYLNSAYEDINRALQYLPYEYGDISNILEAPEAFWYITNVIKYNTVFGNLMFQRIDGKATRAIRARLALLAASPAFNINNDSELWEMAAQYNAELLDKINGIAGLDPNGHLFYLKEQVDEARLNSGDHRDLKEMLWRGPIFRANSMEIDNFPPSLYGNGRTNPSQNLVDIFPMRNGFPINHPNSGYNSSAPYNNRDPRLSYYIIHNGSTFKNRTINTINSTEGIDGIDASINSTRTGYYLRKLLREDVNADPVTRSEQEHYNVHFRYTEIFLNFAEAANEAWGPDGGNFPFTARDVIRAVRSRANIEQPDLFLNMIQDKNEMRKLIQNERRIELCFEGFRFWDLRRWKLDLTEPVRGAQMNTGELSSFIVEEREYNNGFMHYGPIPNSETVRFNLKQNKGWY